jgi:hypothetical protein
MTATVEEGVPHEATEQPIQFFPGTTQKANNGNSSAGCISCKYRFSGQLLAEDPVNQPAHEQLIKDAVGLPVSALLKLRQKLRAS